MPKKISDLTTVSSLQSGDLFELARSGSSLSRDMYDEFSDNIENIKGLLWNTSIGFSQAASALTIFIKQKDGSTDIGTGSARGRIGFRSATLGSGAYSVVDIIATCSTVISATSTVGFVANGNERLHVFACNDAGVIKPAFSGAWNFDEGELHTTTAEGGAGAADSKTTLYSTTALTSVAIRYMGYMVFNLATPGQWTTAPTAIVNAPIARRQIENGVVADTGNGRGSTDTRIRRLTNTTNIGTGSAVTHTTNATNGSTFTINEDGLYALAYADADSTLSMAFGISKNSSQLTTSILTITAADRVGVSTTGVATTGVMTFSITTRLKVGDIIRPHVSGALGDATTLCTFSVRKIGD